jgi:thioredoxin-related protein
MKVVALLLLFFSSSLCAQKVERGTMYTKAPSPILEEEKEINWQTTSLEKTIESAKLENKYILLYFTAKWCGPCRKMDQTIFQDHNIIDIIQNYIAIKVDIDSWGAKTWLKRFPDRGVPVFLILDTTGKPLRRQLGGMDQKQFLAFLDSTTFSNDFKAIDLSFSNSKKANLRGKLTVGFGTGISNITNTKADDAFGYDGKLGISFEKKRLFFNPNLQFASLGNSDLNLKYLRLPIDVGLNAYRGRVLGLPGGYRILLGPYYGVLLNQSGSKVRRYDLGLNYGLGVYMGDIDQLSLEVSLKLSQGFTDVAPYLSEQQNNKYLSISINLGLRKS